MISDKRANSPHSQLQLAKMFEVSKQLDTQMCLLTTINYHRQTVIFIEP